jgi:hypothetical protein
VLSERRRGASARLASVAVAVALALSACASTPQRNEVSASPNPRPSVAAPTPSAAAPVTTLRFSGSAVQGLDSSGATVAAEPFSAGVDATVRLVSEALDAEPVVADNPAECAAANTSYQWDGLLAIEWTGSAGFSISFSAPSSGDVRLETSGGFAPGDNVEAFVAALPESDVGRPGGDELYVAFDVVSTTTDGGDYVSPVGAVGYVPDGATLQSVVTPGEWSSFFC